MRLNNAAIGLRIKEIRKGKHLSQQVLSELIDKSPTYVSYIESGSKGMSLETFILIANALEVSTDLLLAEHAIVFAETASHEIAALLVDCSDYERCIIMDSYKGAERGYVGPAIPAQATPSVKYSTAFHKAHHEMQGILLIHDPWCASAVYMFSKKMITFSLCPPYGTTSLL